MKVLNHIICNLNLIQNFEFNSNSIEKKWHTNWCKGYWQSFHDYNDEKKNIEKI
jgi:hypothetical protein